MSVKVPKVAIEGWAKPRCPTEERFMKVVKSLHYIGFGRMMQLISCYWFTQDKAGALMTGGCYLFAKNEDGTYNYD